MTITPSTVRTVVTGEDDFGHEMRVGHLLGKSTELVLEHGGTYTDPVSKKPRQFDYRCEVQRGDCSLFLTVECKNLSQDSPLVVCGRPRSEKESYHHLIESRVGTLKRGEATAIGHVSVTRQADGVNSLYGPGAFVGKSLLRIKKTNGAFVAATDADIYDKWSQALSSAVAIARQACEFTESRRVKLHLTSIIPIVIVPDGVLWEASYDETGSISGSPSLVDSCHLFVGRRIRVSTTPLPQHFSFSHIHFLTLKGLETYLSLVNAGGREWMRIFASTAREI